MKTRPKFKFLQLPLSVTAYLRTLTSKAASDFLVYLCQRTIAFGERAVTLSYKKIAEVLKVDSRTVSRIAKLLEEKGYILREQTAYRIYRWRVVLQEDDIIADPDNTLTTTSTDQVMTSMSGPSGHECHDHDDMNVMTQAAPIEHQEPGEQRERPEHIEQNQAALKILIKDKNLKKQHQLPAATPASKDDDEPSHKFYLRELQKHGVSKRMARKLCANHDHELIARVLDTAPKRPGIENLPAYIVSEIQDGGYCCAERVGSRASSKSQRAQAQTQTKTQTTTDAPRSLPSHKDTQRQLQALEQERLQKEQSYRDQGRVLANRFQQLTEELQFRLKLLASIQLSRQLPQTGNREQMLKDKAFQRMANRTVLERFFQWVDEGLDGIQALTRLETSFASS